MNKGYEEAAAAAGFRLAEMLRDNRPLYMVVGEVIEVDEATYTITVLVDTDRIFSGIELNLVVNAGNSILLVPAVGSLVILGFLEGLVETPILLKTTHVDKFILRNDSTDDSYIRFEEDYIEIKRGNSIWKIEKEQITLNAALTNFNGGNNGGLINIARIRSLIQALAADLLIAGSGSNLSTWMGKEFPFLEDTKVVH